MIKSYIDKNNPSGDIMMVDVGCAEGQTLINTIAELPEGVQEKDVYPNGIEISRSCRVCQKNTPKRH